MYMLYPHRVSPNPSRDDHASIMAGTPYSQANAQSVLEILAPPVYGSISPTMGPSQGSTEIVVEVTNVHVSPYLS